MPLTKEDVLRKIPMRDGLPKPAFREYYRMLNSYTWTEPNLKMLDACIVGLVKEGDFDER